MTPTIAKPAIMLSPKAQETLTRVRGLRRYTVQTGMRTTRSERDLLSTLNPTDFSAVVLALENDEQ